MPTALPTPPPPAMAAGMALVGEESEPAAARRRRIAARIAGERAAAERHLQGFDHAALDRRARAIAAEIARVEAEIARLAALRAEDQAAAKRAVKPTKSTAAAEKVAAEKAKKLAVWLEGVWDTKLGGHDGVVLKVVDGEGLYGNKVSAVATAALSCLRCRVLRLFACSPPTP